MKWRLKQTGDLWWAIKLAICTMPEAYIKNIDFNLFTKSGIGLLAVADKIIKEIIPARKSDSCEFIQKYLATSKIVERYSTIEKRHLRNNIFTPYTLLQN